MLTNVRQTNIIIYDLFQINESNNSLFKQDFIDTFLERNEKHTSKAVSHPIAKLQQNVK